MTLAPDPFSGIPPIPNQTPILTQLPSSQAAFTKKYTDPTFQSALSSLAPSLRQSMIDYDLTRVGRGQPPLSSQQTLLALQTVQSNRAATQPESPGFLSRVYGDVQSFVGNIPHIPFQLVHEAQQLPDAPTKLSEVLGRGDIQSIAGGLSEVPGLRLVPGVQTLSTLANQGPGGLLQHPVLTALDVLPYAAPGISALSESALSKLPSVTAAREALDLPAINAAREQSGLLPVPEPSAARLAVRESPTFQALRATPGGQFFASRLGSMARDIAQSAYAETHQVRVQVNPETPFSHPAITDDIAPMRAAISDAQSWSDLIPEARRSQLTDAMQLDRNTVLSDPTLTDPERAFVYQANEHAQALADVAIRHDYGLTRLDGEVMQTGDAAKILASRRNVNRVNAINEARSYVSDPTPNTLPPIDPSSILSEHLNKGLRETLVTGYAHALDAAGFDARPLFEAVRDKANAAEVLQQTLANPIPRPILSQSDLTTLLQHPRDIAYARVREDVSRGNYSAALDTFRNTLGQRTVYVHPEAPQILDSLIRLRDQQSFLDRTSTFSDKALTRAQLRNSKVESTILPARWIPTVEKLRTDRLYEMFSTDASATDLISKGFPQLIPALRDNPQLLRDITTDVQSTVAELRASGAADPIFIHRVSASQVPQITYPSITDALRSPTQVRARTLDASPYIHDASIAVSHQAVELLSRLATERFVDHFVNMYGVSEADALSSYLPAATRMAEADSALSVAQHAQSLLQREMTEYDPSSLFPSSQPRVRTFPGKDRIFIPKVAEQTLNQLFHDKGFKFSGVLDPVMNLFRMNVLAFAPRFHINNIGGGAMLSVVEDPSILTRLVKARAFIKSGEYSELENLPSGFGFQPRDIIEWEHRASTADRVMASHSWLAGTTIGRWMNEARGPASAAYGQVKRAADWSYEFNGKVDDLYRAAAYLTGRDKSLTRGLTERQSAQAGEALVRKILPEWDRATPFERNVVRSVFPFYTFAKFILGYAYRYPMDHPFRVAVASSLARNEMQDFGDALPSKFMSMFFLGHPDSNGNVSAVNIGAINPFQDVANYFTLAGFTGKLNPVISSVLETMGIDTSKGAQDLYPEIAYDPVTGTLRPSNPSLLSSFISNILPQSQLISAAIGRNNDFKQVLRTNPEAAAAMLRSQAGLPNIFRHINPAQEAFKAEVQRETLQSQVKNDSLRTGDWSRAQQFPQLRAYFQQVASLMGTNPQLFQQFVPSTVAPSTADAVKQGLLGLNTP